MRSSHGGRWAGGVVLAAALVLAGLYLGSRGGDVPADASRDNLAEALSQVGRDVFDAPPASADDAAADAARPGSMQATLLESTDGNRAHLFSRAIVDAGFECAEVRAVGAVGTGGSAWRANCGETSLYLIEVDEFGRLSAAPMPFGDIFPGTAPTLQFRERE